MLRMTTILACTAALALASCTAPISSRGTLSGGVAPANVPHGDVVDNFARNFLNEIQPQSTQDHVEYCGYFFIDQSGRLFGTPPIRGRHASCDMPAPQAGQGVIASYHTHGAYDRGYDNEVPSVTDLRADFQFGIDGYVSTPGGRVWLVDYETQSTSQLCGLNCVYSDPGFQRDRTDNIQPSYTLPALRDRHRF